MLSIAFTKMDSYTGGKSGNGTLMDLHNTTLHKVEVVKRK